MTTRAPGGLRFATVTAWEATYSSAVFSGIVGDQAHMRTGGYHISIEDQPSATNYSVIGVDDKAPPGDWSRQLASALDMSMSKTDMITSTRRWMAVWSDKSDPRRKYFRGFNGWLGSGNAQRWDFVTGTVGTASNDHQWHQHTEWLRRYADDPMAHEAGISIVIGETKATWMARYPEPGTTPPDTSPIHPKGSRTLRLINPPMNGQDVIYLQRWIGGGKLTIDGVFGPKTEARVKWYQRLEGITADGIVGPRTWAKIGVTMR